MSSASDQVVFEESVTDQTRVNLFQSKKWTYVTDSTSNGGQFSGQIQFDLNTLSSQNQWTDLSQGYIQFPVKLSIKNNSNNTPGSINILAASIKNGFHQFVDSVQVVLGGATVQSSQIFTNIDTNYKILSEWSQDELNKYGPSLGIALDDVQVPQDGAVAITSSIDNQGLVDNTTPVDVGFNMASTVTNPGLKSRLQMNNNTTATSKFGKSILGPNQSLIAKSNVAAGASAVSGADIYVQFYLATIRLKDLSDAIKNMPLVKGMKGFIYVNYNACKSVISNTGTNATITSVQNTATFGRCAPAMVNNASGGLVLSSTATAPVEFVAEVSGVKSSTAAVSGAAPAIQNARLVVPYYVATPEIDRALSMKKTIRYCERFVTQFALSAGQNYNATLSPGISNPKRVILYPYFTGPDSDNQNTRFITNPLISPFDSVPSTTSPFAALKDLQIYVGNQPMFQSPITMDYDTYLNEVAQQGLDGGLASQQSSGLLNQRLWNTLYRYYTCDIGRRMNSEDGASKSVQLSCTNATLCPMSVIAIIWYEREITIDTASGFVSQNK